VAVGQAAGVVGAERVAGRVEALAAAVGEAAAAG
jgi:hypothetical protein